MNGSIIYRVGRAILKLALGFYFSRLVRFHAERVPRAGPVLFTSNHPNSLADAFVIGTSVPRKVSFVATVSLFRFRPLRWLLIQAGVIPVNRVADDPRGMRTVLQTFEACYQVLEPGGAVAIFPEGITHDDPQLKEVRTGAARMALELEHRHGGKLGLQIVPVGLTFSDREIYRSEALVHFGEAIRAAAFLAGYEQNRHECIRRLSKEIEEQIRSLILHVPRLERFRIVRAVRRLYQNRLRVGQWDLARLAPAQVREVRLTRAVAGAVDFVFEHRPEVAQEFVRQLDHYERLLKQLRLPEEALADLRDQRRLFWNALGWTLLAVLAAPVALYGWVHRFPPVWLIERGRRKFGDARRTTVTTGRILGGIVCFTAFYALYLLVFYSWFGWPATLFYALSLPPSGLIAHYYAREMSRFRASLRAVGVLIRSPRVTRHLLIVRSRLIAEIERQRREIPRHLPKTSPGLSTSEPRPALVAEKNEPMKGKAPL